MTANPLLAHVPRVVEPAIAHVDVKLIAGAFWGDVRDRALCESIEAAAGAPILNLRREIVAAAGGEALARTWLTNYLEALVCRAQTVATGLIRCALAEVEETI